MDIITLGQPLRPISFCLLIMMFWLITTGAISQNTWNVTSSADAGIGTLREAIDNSADGDIININVSSEIRIDSGLYVFLKDLTINGNGATVNSGNSKDYTFFFEIGAIVINNLTMKNLSKNFPVITAINDGSVTLNGCTIEDNPTTSNAGGAIFSNIPVILNDCTIQNNTAIEGGGIYMDFNSLTIDNSIIADNVATGNIGYGGIRCIGDFKMSDSDIVDNSAPNGSAGGLLVFSSAIVEISRSKINGNTAKDDAGGCFIFGALDLADSEIKENTSGGTGGGVYFVSVGGTTPSKITNSTISQNTAGHSGGISYSGTSLTITNSNIESNKATQYSAGGLFIGSGMLTLINSTVNNNEAERTGGGIYSNVNCTIDDSEVNENSSSDKGGGIYIFAGKLELKNQSKVNGNTARIDGGGIFLNSSASTQLLATNTSINGNKTINWGGGGIHIRSNGLAKILTNCELKNNTANTQGGAIYNQGDLELNNVIMTGNSANHGGGLYVWSGEVKINNSSVDMNQASSDGGGVYSRSKITIKNNSTISNNTAGQTGGGLWLSHAGQSSALSASQVNNNEARRAAGILIGDGALTIDQGSQVNDNANVGNFDGGGIYNGNAVLTINTASVKNNTTPTHGGGIYVANGNNASLTTDHADISGNTAGQAGGGVYLNTTGNFQNSIINQNTATGPGGGIYVREIPGAKLDVSGSSVNDNKASYGGGIMLYHNINFNSISNCDLKNNQTTQQGGGAWIKANTIITGSTFEGNSSATQGGGIFMDQGTSTLTASSLTMNAANQGAGIYLYTGNLEVQSTSVEQNKSDKAGGGIFQREGLLSISNQSTVNANESENTSGGGIYVDNGELTLLNSEVNNNKVKNGGGGIYLNSKTHVKFSAENSSVNENSTRVYGGGGILIKANNHKKYIRNCLIQGNTAKGEGGGMVNNGKLEILDNSIIKNNESETNTGGGIFNTGELTLRNTDIVDNKASNGGGLYTKVKNVAIEDNTVIKGNEARGYGGGLYLQSGVHLINSAFVLDNQSNNSGGGIYFNEGSLTVENGKVNGNISTGSKGGGIHNEKGALTVKNAEINGNSAFTWGGGVYSSYLNGAVSFSIADSEVNGNTANNGGGISVDVINNYTITNTEFKNNKANNNGGAINIIGGTGMVDISNVTIMNNQAERGGGISNTSLDLKVNNSSISNNQSTNHGGGIYNENNNITLMNSEINGNVSDYNGGGIWNSGTLAISNSELRGNKAQYWGGGIHTFGTTTCQKVILEGNTASDGGGIANVGNLIIDYSTITNNTAVHGGGLVNLNSSSYLGNLSLQNSIISLNMGSNGPDIQNTATISGDHNLLSDFTGSGLTISGADNLTGDPLFESDFNNLSLTKCSPAIDAASNGDDMGAVQSGLAAIVPNITTGSITVLLNNQYPYTVSIDSSMIQYDFKGCTDISISLYPMDFNCSHIDQNVTTTATVTYSGGQSFQQQIPVIVLDEVAPQFTQFPPDTVFVTSGDPLPAPDPGIYMDNCGGAVTFNVSDSAPNTLKCGEQIYRTYTIGDIYGNTSSFVQIIIRGDGAEPEITVWDDERMNITDRESAPVYSVRHDTAFTSFSSDKVLASYCGQSQLIQRTYTAEDVCGNTSTETLDIMFSDEEKPTLVREADFLKKVENGDTVHLVDCIYPDPSRNDISWSDNSGDAIVKTHVFTLPLPDTVPFGMFKLLNYVYEIEDECGNTNWLDFHMALYDLQGPEFQYIPQDTVIASSRDLPPVPQDVVILDVCNYVEWDTVVTSVITDPASGDTTAFSRKWIARDVVGHETFAEQMIHIGKRTRHGSLTARIACYDKLIPDQFEGEIGINGIGFTLNWLDEAMADSVPVEKTTSQNWFGRNGSIWFTGILQGSYQIKVDVPEGYYVEPGAHVDSIGWSDTLTFNGQKVDLGLLVLKPIPEDQSGPVMNAVEANTKSAESQATLQGRTHVSFNQEWNLYPNPSPGHVKFDIEKNGHFEYILLDRAGKQVRKGQITTGDELVLDGLLNGLYFIQLRDGDAVLGYKKLVLMR